MKILLDIDRMDGARFSGVRNITEKYFVPIRVIIGSRVVREHFSTEIT
jgi:hypothetical protein